MYLDAFAVIAMAVILHKEWYLIFDCVCVCFAGNGVWSGRRHTQILSEQREDRGERDEWVKGWDEGVDVNEGTKVDFVRMYTIY